MTDQSLIPTNKPRNPAISRKVRDACDLMVWTGIHFDAAAREVGMSVRNMRLALERPPVLAYLRQQKHVLRESASAANIHAYIDVRDNSENAMARIQAGKAIDQLGDDYRSGTSATQAAPGLTIQIITNSGVGSVVGRPTTTIDQQLIDQSNQGDSE